ncbi:MAG: hypothetical protein QOI20_1940 [Acidimicrobiaceae bacterium]|nr:hypothetical protein [Acidimicrobiaceae bacterium]
MTAPRPVPPPPGVDRWAPLHAYDGPARELQAQLKYRNRRAVVTWLAARMAVLVARWVEQAGPHLAPGRQPPAPIVVTWAPTSDARIRARGFDQAELLALALARRLGLPGVPLLARLPGPPQTGRSRVERRHAPGFRPVSVAGERAPPAVLLVDDVATTGATLGAAARALRAGGVTEVLAVVAGRRL